MPTIVRTQDPLLVPVGEAHLLQDQLTADLAVSAVCEGATILGASSQIKMVFDVAPNEPAMDAVLAAYVSVPEPDMSEGAAEIKEDRTSTSVPGLALVTIFEETFTVEIADYELWTTWQARPTIAVGNAGILVSVDDGTGYAQVENVTSHDAGTIGAAATTTWSQVADVSFSSAGDIDVKVEAQEYGSGVWTNDRTRVKLVKVN